MLPVIPVGKRVLSDGLHCLTIITEKLRVHAWVGFPFAKPCQRHVPRQ